MIDKKEEKTSSSAPFNSDYLVHQLLKNSICFWISVAVRKVAICRQEQQLSFELVGFILFSKCNGVIRKFNLYRSVNPYFSCNRLKSVCGFVSSYHYIPNFIITLQAPDKIYLEKYFKLILTKSFGPHSQIIVTGVWTTSHDKTTPLSWYSNQVRKEIYFA